MQLFDSHCHPYLEASSGEFRAQIDRSRDAGVDQWLMVGIDLPTSIQSRELAREVDGARAAAGLHPNEAGGQGAALRRGLHDLEQLIQDGGWAAVGETGMDLYRKRSPEDLQREAFEFHLDLARRTGLPVIIHCRNAAGAVLEVLRAHGDSIRGVMHCYSEGPEYLDDLLSLGLHVSFAGNLTYPKSDAIRESARQVPLDRILVETDAPFLAPQQVRGKRNEPAHVALTLMELARVRGEDPQALPRATRLNAERLFPVPGDHENAA